MSNRVTNNSQMMFYIVHGFHNVLFLLTEMKPVRILDDRYWSKPVRPDRTGRSIGNDRSTGRPGPDRTGR